METREERRKRIRKFVALSPLMIAGVAVFVALFSYIVMRLWNWLAPDIFGLGSIDPWQALGLLVLCKILFGGFHFGSDDDDRSRRWEERWEERWEKRRAERWEAMTPEERERLRGGAGDASPSSAD